MILSKLLKKYLKQKKDHKIRLKKSNAIFNSKGFEMETIHAVLNEMDFTQDEAVLDDLLQRDLEKFIIKIERSTRNRN